MLPSYCDFFPLHGKPNPAGRKKVVNELHRRNIYNKSTINFYKKISISNEIYTSSSYLSISGYKAAIRAS